ncbi:hypothetical protein ACIRP3_41775 [Streptomyces sp. NPDC101209]|uniref:hypothetical protein n=1 Tax=Streptomyces sp. NPDC101209 TaxID=3366129 RepID=UPI003821A8AB
MATAIIAAAAALLGTVVAGLMQILMHSTLRREERHHAAVEALASLMGAATDYRAHQYLKQTVRERGLDEPLETRVARYETRAKVTKAMVAVQLTVTDQRILRLADDLLTTSFALGDVPEDLPTARSIATSAHNNLQEAAAKFVRQASYGRRRRVVPHPSTRPPT